MVYSKIILFYRLVPILVLRAEILMQPVSQGHRQVYKDFSIALICFPMERVHNFSGVIAQHYGEGFILVQEFSFHQRLGMAEFNFMSLLATFVGWCYCKFKINTYSNNMSYQILQEKPHTEVVSHSTMAQAIEKIWLASSCASTMCQYTFPKNMYHLLVLWFCNMQTH